MEYINQNKIIMEIFIDITGCILLISLAISLVYAFVKEKGKALSKEDKSQIKTLKNGDMIAIYDNRYDRVAEYRASSPDHLHLKVSKGGILIRDLVVLPKTSFICKVEKTKD